jgi:RNA polymerase sigma-70 factor (ECF subfamily)
MTSMDSDAQDTQDMARLAAGHDAALNELMERHGEKLFHYLIRCLQDEEEAADLAQETFVRVYQHRARFDSGQKFSTWLYTIASNLVRDRYRWRARHPQVSLSATHEETGTELGARLAHPGASPRESLETTERVAAIQNAVAGLPEELRAPLILAEYEDKPQAEIAQTLSCSVKAVETRIYRARKQLRTALGFLIGQGGS